MNAMIDQIRSIPALIEEIVPRYAENIQNAVTADWISDVNQIFLTGCGDSYHVALGSELAFRQLAGVSTTPLTSMQFATPPTSSTGRKTAWWSEPPSRAKSHAQPKRCAMPA
jgi:glucosamine 6-phosphate synthetase-like amidotransferase/phosphosugar isomerase protein